ncbi:tyrosine-type recombinase/integrase [Christiangramia salexigens]|uniref:Integrase n=1 Tax=Christiangramia salexigens TaxID=1913577 RepID=A0A1L3J3W2_9FLAO|nr:tyrosine-type recombinase/integrase [Christiangramia salexigens]APG59825.1 integrase [Christiangramia salexigens]
MEQVILRPFFHRGQHQVGVFFKYNSEIREHLKLLRGLTWSKTFSCFYLPDNPENRNLLKSHMEAGNYTTDCSAFIKTEESEVLLKDELDTDSKQLLEAYILFLRGKRYSQSTVSTYCNFVNKFLLFNDAPLTSLKNRHLELFIEKVIARNNYSISSHRQCISAFTHLAVLLELPELDLEKMNRPRKSRILPVILSPQEIIDILVATRNLKHRAALALIYASGLRVGELMKLKLNHIDIDRRQLLIKQAKGRKDRYVGMADSFIPLLINYLNTYQPKVYFLEGPDGKEYSASSVRSFLKESCRRAGIRKKVSPHSLRHAYATHMLENGIGLRYIQALLGHSRPETTMIYTQVTQMDMVQIKSPLDLAVTKYKGDKAEGKLRLSRNSNL